MGNFIKQFFDIKFWKFILVGILNTVVGMGLQFLFFNLCGWNEWVSRLSATSSAVFKLFSQQILHIQKQGQGLETNR